MKKAIEQYNAARAAHIAAKEHERATLTAFRQIPRENIRDNIEALKAASAAHDAAAVAEQRAARIRQAAAYIAEQTIKAAAAPIIRATLEKYAGKPAGPKTREKAAAEIAAALDVKSAYFSGSYYGSPLNRVCINLGSYGNDISPEIYTQGMEPLVNAENRFQVQEIPAPDLSGLPADLEAWVDEFDRAADELEAAKKAFEAAAAHARRVNLGNARLKEYRITGY